ADEQQERNQCSAAQHPQPREHQPCDGQSATALAVLGSIQSDDAEDHAEQDHPDYAGDQRDDRPPVGLRRRRRRVVAGRRRLIRHRGGWGGKGAWSGGAIRAGRWRRWLAVRWLAVRWVAVLWLAVRRLVARRCGPPPTVASVTQG